MIDAELQVKQSFGRLWPEPDPEQDWDAILLRWGVRAGRARPRVAAAIVVVAALAAVLAATPLGATIARSLWDFPAWLHGHPGSPASSQAQKEFERANARSWTAFPKGTQLRQLISTRKAGVAYTLYGFRSGGELCLRVVVSGTAAGKSTGCAPLSDLRSRPAPALAVEVDDNGFGIVRGKHVLINGTRYTVDRAGTTFGIVADGVRSVVVRSSDATRRALVGNNAFLLAVSEPKTGARVQHISAKTEDGHGYSVPFAQAPFGAALGIGAATGTLHGPAEVQREVHGGTIAWLTGREPRGAPLPPGFPSPLGGTHSELVYGRLIQPDPQSPLRVSVTLYRVRSAPKYTSLEPGLYICDFLVQGRGAGGGCSPLGSAFEHEPFASGSGMVRGSDQYETVGGVVSDQVARLRIFFGDGGAFDVPFRDNAFATLVSRARLPFRLVAYDAESRIIGIDTEGSDAISAPPSPVKGAGWTTLGRATAVGGATATIGIKSARGGGLCWRIRFSDLPGSKAVCTPPTWQGPPVNLVVQDTAGGGALVYGRVSPRVAAVVIRYRDGRKTTVTPRRGFVLVGAPQRVKSPANPVAQIIGLDRNGRRLGVEDYRHTPALPAPAAPG
jgi:hypothetical protein